MESAEDIGHPDRRLSIGTARHVQRTGIRSFACPNAFETRAVSHAGSPLSDRVERDAERIR